MLPYLPTVAAQAGHPSTKSRPGEVIRRWHRTARMSLCGAGHMLMRKTTNTITVPAVLRISYTLHFYDFIIPLAHMLRKRNRKTFFDSSKPLITSMCPFVGTLRLSMDFLLDFGVDIQGKSDFISALKVIFVIFKVVNSFKQLLQHGVPGRCVPVPVVG